MPITHLKCNTDAFSVAYRTTELVAQTNQHAVNEGGDEDLSVFVISDSMYGPQDEAVSSSSTDAALASMSVDGEFGLKQLQPEIDVAGSNGQANGQAVSAEYSLASQDAEDGAPVATNGAAEERQALEGLKL
jgi:hypothetical protein